MVEWTEEIDGSVEKMDGWLYGLITKIDGWLGGKQKYEKIDNNNNNIQHLYSAL